MASPRALLFVVISLSAAGCGNSTSTDAGTDAGVDAPMPHDSGLDAAMHVDAGVDMGGSDAGVDAGSVDASVDAGGTDAGSADAGTPDAAVDPCLPHTFVVTTDGASYQFDGGAHNPTLTLCHGVTYMFDLTAIPSFHPMEILSAGVTVMAVPAGATTSYTIPATIGVPDQYRCAVHHFGGAIIVP